MNLPMLVVDSDIQVYQREQAAWLEEGISTVHTDSMQEAIEKLDRESFFIIAINADNINYIPLLRVMRDITHILIFIYTSHYTVKDKTEALHNGADEFVPFHATAKEDVMSALATIHRYSERSAMPKKAVKMLSCQGLLFFPKYDKVFYRDAEIELTKTEYDIFSLLVANPNQPLSPSLIYRKARGREYDETAGQVVWQHINTPIQGTAADILKLALGRIIAGLPERPWLRPLLQIHDELVFELPEERADEATAFIRGCMEAQPFPEFDLPIIAEAAVGPSFGKL